MNIRKLEKSILAGLLALATFFPFQAHAGLSTSFVGDLTCGQYVEAVEGKSFHPYDNYIAGFLTGTNYLRSRVSPTAFSDYRVWMKTYCQQNPFDLFDQALARLDYSLGEGTEYLKGTPTKNKNAKK